MPQIVRRYWYESLIPGCGNVGKLIAWASSRLKPKLMLEIVKRPDDLHTFKVLPRR